MWRFGGFALHATTAVLYAAAVTTNGDKYATRRIGGHRYTVPEAAEALGVTVDAIRSRIKRQTIMHVREDGRVYVLLSGDQGFTSNDQVDDQGAAHHADQPPQTGPDHRDELLEELRDRVRALEEANRENRRIIAGLVQRIPELEATPEPRDESETVAETSEGTSPRSGTVGAQTSAEEHEESAQNAHFAETPRRPWWRRIFGG